MSLPSIFPSEVSELVQEYEEGIFRIRESKTNFIVNKKDTIGYTLPTTPGLWKVTIGPKRYTRDPPDYLPLGVQALIFHKIGSNATFIAEVQMRINREKTEEDVDEKLFIEGTNVTNVQLCTISGSPLLSLTVPGAVRSLPYGSPDGSSIIFALLTHWSEDVKILNRVYEYLGYRIAEESEEKIGSLYVRAGYIGGGGSDDAILLTQVSNQSLPILFPGGIPNWALSNHGVYRVNTDRKINNARVMNAEEADIDATQSPLIAEISDRLTTLTNLDPNTIMNDPSLRRIYDCAVGLERKGIQIHGQFLLLMDECMGYKMKIQF